MNRRKKELRFGSLEEIKNFGEEKIFNELESVLSDFNEDYIMKITHLSEFTELFGFVDNNEVKEELFDKPISIFSKYLRLFVKNLIKQLENKTKKDKSDFISTINLNKSDIIVYFIQEYNYTSNVKSDFSLGIKIPTNYGSVGRSCRVAFISRNYLNDLKEHINKMDINSLIKQYYYRVLDSNEFYEDEFEDIVESLKEDLIDHLKECLSSFMSNKKYNNEKTFEENELKENLLKFLKENKSFEIIKDLIDAHYDDFNKNRINITLDNEVIKSFEKITHISYEII